MEVPLEPLLTLEEFLEGKPTKVEIREEVADSNEVIARVTLVQEGVESRTYDMRFTSCEGENAGAEPHWKFVSEVPGELKEIEWTISEAILEKDM